MKDLRIIFRSPHVLPVKGRGPTELRDRDISDSGTLRARVNPRHDQRLAAAYLEHPTSHHTIPQPRPSII